MKRGRLARGLGWGAGGCLLFVVVACLSFCVAFRAERRTNVVTVPDLTGQPRSAAQSEAASLGLVLLTAGQRHDPGVAVDSIVRQDPPAGAVVRRGRTVRVTVSLGGETIAVPDIVRHPARQAEAEIRRQGLDPGFETRVRDADVPEGQVMAQTPPPGTMAVSGERIHRLVSDGPRPPRWVMPNLVGRPLRVAQDWITLCGFRSGPVRRMPSEGKVSGTILGQHPPPGSRIGPRDVVELTVVR